MIYNFLLPGSAWKLRSKLRHLTPIEDIHYCGITMVDPSRYIQPSLSHQICWRWLKISWWLPNSHVIFRKDSLNEHLDSVISYLLWHDTICYLGLWNPSFRSCCRAVQRLWNNDGWPVITTSTIVITTTLLVMIEVEVVITTLMSPSIEGTLTMSKSLKED